MKPSGDMLAFPIVSVVAGPIAAKVTGKVDVMTPSASASPAVCNMAIVVEIEEIRCNDW